MLSCDCYQSVKLLVLPTTMQFVVTFTFNFKVIRMCTVYGAM